MEDHDGKIIVQNFSDSTSFQLFFPAVTQKSYSSKSLDPPTKNPAPAGNGESILIVDDEEIPRRMAKHVLLSLGYQVHMLESGEEAVSFVQDKPVDLVILDMLMEPGISGYETYRQILQIRPQQKAIVISSYSNNVDVEKTLDLGAAAFLRKPYDLTDIATAVSTALHTPTL